MQELTVQFTPADGTPPRPITLRMGAPMSAEGSWVALVEVTGFERPYACPIHGEDWAETLELSARLLPVALQSLVSDAGGGTLSPPFSERNLP